MKHKPWPFEELGVGNSKENKDLTDKDRDSILKQLKVIYKDSKATTIEELIDEQFFKGKKHK